MICDVKCADTKPLSYQQLSDAELIGLVQQNDSRAFEILLSRYNTFIQAMLYKMAPEFADKSDLYQEVCIKVWKNIDKLRSKEAFKSWLRQIANNVVYDQFRAHKPTCSLDSMFSDENEAQTMDIPDHSAGPAEQYQTKCLQDAVESALSHLPESFRTALLLRAVNDLPYQEIADITKTDLGTVKSRISRAREKVCKIVSIKFAEERTA